jgi:hypothetical protein
MLELDPISGDMASSSFPLLLLRLITLQAALTFCFWAHTITAAR